MIIKNIKLNHFRNYKECRVSFDEKLNIIYGDNAQGKTNILEAIYMCATSKSHRTNNFKEMIEMEMKEAHIHVDIMKDESEYEIDAHLNATGKKQFAINKLPIKKLNELLGILHVIMFSPEDLSLIKSGPRERRRFVDLELSQLSSVYFHYLQQYHKLLKQRNALLKQCFKNPSAENREQLDIWDLQFVHYGVKVIELREKFIDDLKEIYKKRHFEISGGKELMELKYDKNIDIEMFEEKLKKNQDKDIRFGTTSVGPHRDDLMFDLNGVDLRKYGSQGQQRTAALSLKLSEIDLVIERKEENPVLLLDDVLSELDANRQKYLMDNLSGIQTFITCTGVEDFIKQDYENREFFHVTSGEIA
jgi:DNA replication and repair protein RecF